MKNSIYPHEVTKNHKFAYPDYVKFSLIKK